MVKKLREQDTERENRKFVEMSYHYLNRRTEGEPEK